MPAHHSKSGVETIVAQQVEEWAIKFQRHYDEKLHNVHVEQRETLAIVNSLGKYVNNLELKVNAITNNMKGGRNGAGEFDLPSSMNTYHSPIKVTENDDISNRLSLLEKFCGYDPEKEAYAALGLGNGDLILPQHKLNNRLEKLETTVSQLDQNIKQIESGGGDYGHERNPVSSSGGHGGGTLATGFFFPEKTRPKSTHGDPRHRSHGRDGHSHANGHGNNNAFSTPHPPPHNGTFGYRSAPTKSRNVTRPGSAPNTQAHGHGQAQKGQIMHKAMEDIRNQIEDVDEKNNIQNTFMMSELMENISSQEATTDRKLYNLDAKLRKYVDSVEDKITKSMNEVETGVRSKITQMEGDISQLQSQEKAIERDIEDQAASQHHIIDQITEEKEKHFREQQDTLRESKEALHEELQKKNAELKDLASQNAATQEAFRKLQDEAKLLERSKDQMKKDHLKHIEHLEQEFEARRALVDERTELYKAETARLKSVHKELQDQVNLEIKQFTGKLEDEKHHLEEKLTEEMTMHNLQIEKDRVIRESLQSDIEMYKKSCSQAHQEKDQILAKLKVAEAKYADLEAKLKSSASQRSNSPSAPYSPFYKTQKPKDLALLSFNEKQPPVQDEEDEDPNEEDTFAYDTPVSKFPSDKSQHGRHIQRTDTPIPKQHDNPFLQNKDEIAKPTYVLSPDTLKKQKSKKNMSSSGKPRQETAENDNNHNIIGVPPVDDRKLQEMVQNNLTQNDIDDIIVLEELIKEKEAELEQASAAKSRAKKKIKNWMSDFQKTNKRPPNQSEKEGVSDLYINHQKLSDNRQDILDTLDKLKEKLQEKVNKAVP